MHLKKGLFIEKYPDGAVEVNDSDDGRNGAYILTSDEWVSAIAEVADGYEDPSEAVRFAQAFHDGSVRELLHALELILAEPHGCPFCDSGKLRKPMNPAKGHTADCGFDAAQRVVAKLGVPFPHIMRLSKLANTTCAVDNVDDGDTRGIAFAECEDA
jgi:hypothetical protein